MYTFYVKIYNQIQDLSLYHFESMSDGFGILGIKELRIFLKNTIINFSFMFYYFNLQACKYVNAQITLKPRIRKHANTSNMQAKECTKQASR